MFKRKPKPPPRPRLYATIDIVGSKIVATCGQTTLSRSSNDVTANLAEALMREVIKIERFRLEGLSE